jgi:hypothetical protein
MVLPQASRDLWDFDAVFTSLQSFPLPVVQAVLLNARSLNPLRFRGFCIAPQRG